jgi:hypothetical protein
MAVTVLKMGISGIPAYENIQMAAPPFMATSRKKKVGNTDAIRYMAVISGAATGKETETPKKRSKT